MASPVTDDGQTTSMDIGMKLLGLQIGTWFVALSMVASICVLVLMWRWERPRLELVASLMSCRYDVNVDDGLKSDIDFELTAHNTQCMIDEGDITIHRMDSQTEAHNLQGSISSETYEIRVHKKQRPGGGNIQLSKSVAPGNSLIGTVALEEFEPTVEVVELTFRAADGKDASVEVEIPSDKWPEERLVEANVERERSWSDWFPLRFGRF